MKHSILDREKAMGDFLKGRQCPSIEIYPVLPRRNRMKMNINLKTNKNYDNME